jgi:hypothetical protein
MFFFCLNAHSFINNAKIRYFARHPPACFMQSAIQETFSSNPHCPQGYPQKSDRKALLFRVFCA